MTGPQQTSEPVLAAHDLAIAAGGRVLARGIDLRIDAGQSLGVGGPSGCGKTTLLRALAGLDDPAEGRVTLEGRAPGDWGWPAYRRKVVLVNQTPALIDASVRDNLAKPFAYGSAECVFPEEEARALLQRLQLEDAVWGQSARTLSVGQQQRVCFARALLLQPKVLLLDEPTSALDRASAEALEAAVREAQRGGAAIVLVSHDHVQQEAWSDSHIDLADYRGESAA